METLATIMGMLERSPQTFRPLEGENSRELQLLGMRLGALDSGGSLGQRVCGGDGDGCTQRIG